MHLAKSDVHEVECYHRDLIRHDFSKIHSAIVQIHALTCASDYNLAMADKDWMRSDFKPPQSSPQTREEESVFVLTKDVRVMTGALRRVDDER
jgi:hypothetical protein